MPPIGSPPSNPASFMTRNFSSTGPFTPIVEYMIALRRLRFEAAEADGRKAVAAAVAAAIFRNDRRFIKVSFGHEGVSGAGRGCQWERGCLVLEQPQHVDAADCCGWSSTQPRSD